MTSIPVVLCFSGSDPSGGAGIAADFAAVHALEGHCAGVITALTIQNTCNAFDFIPTDPSVMLQQAAVLMDDLPVKAIKIGMLSSVENVIALSQWLKNYPAIPVVFDPVMVASGGGALAQHSIIEAMKTHLFPLIMVLTPNSIETRELAPTAVTLNECAASILSTGCQYVLLKGSHEDTPQVTNILYNSAGILHRYQWPRLPFDYHGSGCTLAASIAVLLARNFSITQAMQEAQEFTWECLAQAYRPGKGQHIPNRWYKNNTLSGQHND